MRKILIFYFLINLTYIKIDAQMQHNQIKLPAPVTESKTSIEKAIKERRSIRKYRNIALSINELSQLLWAGQGITDSFNKYRSYPSAGALFPLELYVAINKVEKIEKGLYYYDPFKHVLIKKSDKDIIPEITQAALNQQFINESAIVLIYTAIKSRSTSRYGERGLRYIYMEAGHAAQNIYLQAVSLNLGVVVIGAFIDKEISKILNLKDDEIPVYIIPVGKK